MKNPALKFFNVSSIGAYHELLGIGKPDHPLVSIIDFSKTHYSNPDWGTSVVMNLYCISIKQGAECILRYGPQTYDFSEGVMSFLKPGQVIAVADASETVREGFTLAFHPDFIQHHRLAQEIHKYGFFDYAVSEALFLSEKEKHHIGGIMESIMQEYHTNIDAFSQDAVISYIELLLVYSNRYYNRQFITRKPKNDKLLERFEKELEYYFNNGLCGENGLPSVHFFATQLHLSPNYLSDMLRITTGNGAQYHIQEKIIEKTKILLSTSHLSVSEIAYQLGFERPQSLNKLFKRKTAISPLDYRSQFN